MTPEQKAAIAAKLGVDLASLDSDRLIELCLLHRAQPKALESFPNALAAEINRRFTAAEIARDDVPYSVLQHFANQFTGAAPLFQRLMQEMAASINRDIWFTDNAEVFKAALANEEAATWLAGQPDILNKCLQNRLALGYIAQSTTTATAILTREEALAQWKNAPALWDIWPQHAAGMQVLAKSAELMQYVIDTAAALAAVVISEAAMKAVAASEVAMKAVAASEVAMKAVAASEVAMKAVAAINAALKLVTATEEKRKLLMTHNEALQAARTIMYETVQRDWTKVRQTTLRDGSGGVGYYEDGNSALANPVGALVFVCLGSYGENHPNGRHQLEHPDGSLAASGGYRDFPQSMIAVDGVSFAGARVKQTVQFGGSYAEVWAPKA